MFDLTPKVVYYQCFIHKSSFPGSGEADGILLYRWFFNQAGDDPPSWEASHQAFEGRAPPHSSVVFGEDGTQGHRSGTGGVTSVAKLGGVAAQP